jgi:UDP-N-acetyl-D-glucosamine dehydrogenase
LGISYRGDVGDTRFTPVEPLVKMVRDTGAEIVLHDPFISYWEEQECEVCFDLVAALEVMPDLIIISTGHSEYKSQNTIQRLLELEPTNIYDTIGLLSYEQILLLQNKHIVSVLGRGDL